MDDPDRWSRYRGFELRWQSCWVNEWLALNRAKVNRFCPFSDREKNDLLINQLLHSYPATGLFMATIYFGTFHLVCVVNFKLFYFTRNDTHLLSFLRSFIRFFIFTSLSDVLFRFFVFYCLLFLSFNRFLFFFFIIASLSFLAVFLNIIFVYFSLLLSICFFLRYILSFFLRFFPLFYISLLSFF